MDRYYLFDSNNNVVHVTSNKRGIFMQLMIIDEGWLKEEPLPDDKEGNKWTEITCHGGNVYRCKHWRF